MAKNIIPLIMAGGKGSRFWPLSRDKFPKQFLSFHGDKSLLERTYERAMLLGGEISPYIVAAEEQKPLVLSHCGREISEEQVITEPIQKNTAAAIYWSCLKIQKRHNDGIMVVMPADHQIPEDDKFLETIHAAAAVAEQENAPVVIGVKPRYIATGFGYVERGKRFDEGELKYYKVRRFVEKPHREKARRYLKKGTYDWNSGIFIFPLNLIFSLFDAHLPGFSLAFRDVSSVLDTPEEALALANAFSKVDGVSFDVGILEKTKDIYLVETTFSWDDVGSYNSLGAIMEQDEQGNIKKGNVILNDVANSVILCDSKLVSVIGVRDLVVVEDHGVLLICPRKRVEEIKEVVNTLEGENKEFS